MEDLADLYLFHDLEGLSWHLSADDWITVDADNKTWIGSYNIGMADSEGLPRGQFRAVIVDKGGEQSERNFTFDAAADPRFPFPAISVEGGRYTVESQYPDNYIVHYDDQGNLVNYYPIRNPSGELAELGVPVTGAVALWADDGEYLTSAMTDVVRLR
jgi:hypothetical protein